MYILEAASYDEIQRHRFLIHAIVPVSSIWLLLSLPLTLSLYSSQDGLNNKSFAVLVAFSSYDLRFGPILLGREYHLTAYTKIPLVTRSRKATTRLHVRQLFAKSLSITLLSSRPFLKDELWRKWLVRREEKRMKLVLYVDRLKLNLVLGIN